MASRYWVSPNTIVQFSVLSQTTTPTSLSFKDDGTKMYVLGTSAVYEYSLSSAWNINTASYVQSFSTSSQGTAAYGLFFKQDGTKMYVVTSTNDNVNEYSLSTAWNISTASYVQNKNVTDQDTTPAGLFFKSDGTKMYVVGTVGDDINEYDLSVAWDVSTATYLQNFSVASQDGAPWGLFFKTDGTKMYITGVNSDAVLEYSLSSAWNVSTASYVRALNVSSQEVSPYGVFFKSDGTKLYVTGDNSDAVNSYPLSTAWNVSPTNIDTWNGTAGTKWSATSGGAGGASVPTTADDVYFDASSYPGIVTIASGNTGARSINCTGFVGALAGTDGITVAGSITLVAGMTYTHTGTVTMTGTGTLVTAGKAFSILGIAGSGITVTLGDALNLASRALTVGEGTFDTGGYNVTCSTLSSSNSNTRTINLNASTVTLSSTVTFTTSTNLTFNAGTSQINISNANATFAGGNQTFYNVSLTSTSVGVCSITGSNTFNNLTRNVSAAGLSQISFLADQTVTGTLTCAGTSAVQRGFVFSNTIGTTRTITAAAVSANDCDFRDITIAGAAAPISPTRAGDCGGNSGITFPAAKTVYRVGVSGSWTAVAWALTSGGTGDAANFPLPQDTAIINEDTVSASLSVSAYNIGSIDASTRTTAFTLNQPLTPIFYGNYTLGSGITVSGTGAHTFSGRGTQTFTSAGKTITFNIAVDKPAGAFELGDAYNSSGTITHTRGTFDAKNYNLTCTTFSSSNSNVRTINMGSGLWTLSSTATVWTTVTATNLTLNKDTANILLSDTSTSARNFLSGAGVSYNKLTIGGTTGTSTLVMSGGVFTELASIKTVAHTIRIQAATPTIDTWSVTGTAGNLVTVDSSNVGTRRTFTLTNSTAGLIDYLSVKDIGVASPNLFYVGDNSINGGNNVNVYFRSFPLPDTGNMFFMFN